MSKLMTTRRCGVLVAAVALLASCSGGGGDDRPAPPPVAETPAPPPVAETPKPPPVITDAFVTYVTQLSANEDDGTEPTMIDDVAETEPETDEPQPVPGG